MHANGRCPPCHVLLVVVTSLGAAALHDVVTALQRRVPHIPVVLAPAAVQGDNAPRELMQALSSLYGQPRHPVRMSRVPSM